MANAARRLERSAFIQFTAGLPALRLINWQSLWELLGELLVADVVSKYKTGENM